MAITWKVLVSVLLYLTCKTYLISDVEVIPLQSLSVVDVAGTEVKENEILAHALTNVSQLEQSEGWVIKQSADFINEYPRTSGDGTLLAGTPEDPNHLLGTFPYLFPCTLGGFEVDWPTSVSHESHSHWALHYSDKCFCEDHFFMFQVFSMLQKHQMCAAATLQILKLSFSQHQCAISCLSGIGTIDNGSDGDDNYIAVGSMGLVCIFSLDLFGGLCDIDSLFCPHITFLTTCLTLP